MARTPLTRGLAALAAAATTVAGAAVLVGPGTSSASSHREAPLIASDPQADNTDVYAFVSPDKPDTVTLIANWIPFEEPAGGPNFYPWATNTAYNIKVDSNGDALADLTYRWTFTSEYLAPNSFIFNNGPVTSLTDENLLHRQTYDLEIINGAGVSTLLLDNAKVAPSHVGNASMPDYAKLRDEAVSTFTTPSGQASSYAGQADDPFFLDLRVFDLLYGGDFGESGQDTLNGFNTNTIALQVPKNVLAINGDATRNPVVGVWSTTERRTTRVLAATDSFTGTAGSSANETGPFAQVSRLGNPLVNEVVIPVGQKDRFNNSTPANDGQFLDFVTKPELPKLVEAVYGVKAPAEPRNDLVAVFLTGVDGLNTPALNQDKGTLAPSEVLRLNMSIAPAANPNRLGVIAGDTAGFPNGRRLADDVIDIALQVVEGELVGNANDLGDSVSVNDKAFGTTFPYVALPHSGSTNKAVTGTGTGPKPGAPAPSASASPSASPGPGARTPAAVTLRADVTQITSGNRPTLSGTVTDSSGNPVADTTVQILQKRYAEASYSLVAPVTTDASGRFSLAVQPSRQTSYGANVTDSVRSNIVNIRVSTRVNIASPAPGAVANPVTFTGSLQPGYANVAVGLGTIENGRFVVLQQTTTDAAGNYRITRTLRSGTNTFVVFTSAHEGTDKGSKSVSLTVR